MKNLHIPAAVRYMMNDNTRHTIQVKACDYDELGTQTQLGLLSVTGEGYNELCELADSCRVTFLPKEAVAGFIALCKLLPKRKSAMDPNVYFQWYDNNNRTLRFDALACRYKRTRDNDGLDLLVFPFDAESTSTD